jgi:hypothetical protein
MGLAMNFMASVELGELGHRPAQATKIPERSTRLHFVNKFRVSDKAGVAVAFGRSEPLMRVFNRKNEPASPVDVAVATKLQAITDRARTEVRHYLILDMAMPVQRPQRLVRRPDEIVAENGVA